MTPETEKLAEALQIEQYGEEYSIEMIRRYGDFEKKYKEHPSTTVTKAARQFAEVLPLLREFIDINPSDVEVVNMQDKIAAIVARGE